MWPALLSCDILLMTMVERWQRLKPGFWKTRPFCQTRNPGLRAAETRVLGWCFFSQLHSVHFCSRSCNSLIRLSLVIVHKLSKCLFLLVLRHTDYWASRTMRCVYNHGSHSKFSQRSDQCGLDCDILLMTMVERCGYKSTQNSKSIHSLTSRAGLREELGLQPTLNPVHC